ncbi:tRNA (guanosine(46)-N7)-methyltransferase TrmB [Botrimarina mediterranea]|uniref:tRNA (guanine-N(7)-)-methyltransferase n=1 Tax=Botrimarina mediterranea TaxID=2528022 RepID=A0A518KDI2_9BACT|nr:tRNA (guanosine(46)-N7)-methyltransferase TrmB [Botrimarina mediterranea]QDV75848.1 tRNA (guanine-N(7)-)-methyltransferase [Botrimarina mediterranea]QDV80445.1 tRNA (guanine-N(7)-)-methyltransferase [Planctomycetes bacterium K2D]
MGRRAVRNVHEGLDLTGKLLSFDDLPNPWENAASLFDVDRPLEIEVGSGKGLFLRRATAANPEHNFLGIEVAFKYARFAAANLLRDGRTNGVIAACDALRVFRELVPDASLEAVHVYFPDPWWKARHRKRRVLNEAFLADVGRTLRPGGVLHFWTDVEEYYVSTLEIIDAMRAASPRLPLTGPHPVEEPESEHDLDFHTHFERRTRKNGEPVYRSEFVKLGG